jgi:LPS sulfotransferase NodH
MLTEGRSGSNWLGTLANSTGQMGNLEEWIGPNYLGTKLKNLGRGAFLEQVFQKASSENGRFAIKLFPRHIHMVQHVYGFDFIAETCRHHDTALIFLQREDRHRQAISFARARMSGQWRSDFKAKGDEGYDFDLICRYYFYIERSYAFWKSYLELRGFDYHEFSYEALTDDAGPYISRLAELLDVDLTTAPQTNLRVQRDTLTEEWLKRFQSDIRERNVVASSLAQPRPSRQVHNLWRFLRGQQMTPLPSEFGNM